MAARCRIPAEFLARSESWILTTRSLKSMPFLICKVRWLILTAMVVAAASIPASAQDGSTPEATKKVTAKAAPKPDDEEIALAFVREHHPELAELVLQLKPMKPTEYQKAVRELAQVSRTLGDLKGRDPKRYEFGLNAWKARSRVQVLSARLASAIAPNPDLESQLRHAIEEQVDQEILRMRYERAMAEERLKRVRENLERAETRHDQMIENRFRAQLKAAEKARQKSAALRKNSSEAKSNPKPPQDEKGKNQP
jgi:hypothetical protein